MMDKVKRGDAAKAALPKDSQLLAGLVLFMAVAGLIVVVNSLAGYGFHLNYSVSKYVGLEWWSSLLFLLSNIVVSVLVGRYAWNVGRMWKMPRVYYYCVTILVVTLLWLSMCPVGFCDVDGRKSLMTWLHEISSRTMFLMMLFIGIIFAVSKRATRCSRIVSIVFVIYGIFCVVGYFTKGEWFKLLICETAYIGGFMLLLYCQRKMLR